MTAAEIQAWAAKAGEAAVAMSAAPAMMETINRMVEAAYEATPSLSRTDVTRAALTVLAWSQLSAAAHSGAAQTQTKNA